MKLISAESIKRPEVVRWQRRMVDRYTPQKNIGLTVFLPCSAKKPYSKSKSHRDFRKCIQSASKSTYPLVHEVILTSPFGLVPRELENIFPVGHYDVPVTGVWSEEEKKIVTNLLADYLSKSSVPAICHVEGPLNEICESMGIETTNGDPMELEKLLKEKLSSVNIRQDISEKIMKLRALCDFQFGKGAWKHLLGESPKLKGFQVYADGELIATVNRYTGLLALSLSGGEKILSFGRYIVELSFNPMTSSLFCVGIKKADTLIRPHDEVVVTYEKVLRGVGRALLNGEEMERAKKGLGIKLRHRR
jgi:archaeosine synthase